MKNYVYWILAVIITLVLSIYQRMTGPTYPKKVTVELNGGSYKVKLPRSGVQHDETVTLKGVPSDTKAQLHYRRYPTIRRLHHRGFHGKTMSGRQRCPYSPLQGNWSITSQSMARTI